MIMAAVKQILKYVSFFKDDSNDELRVIVSGDKVPAVSGGKAASFANVRARRCRQKALWPISRLP